MKCACCGVAEANATVQEVRLPDHDSIYGQPFATDCRDDNLRGGSKGMLRSIHAHRERNAAMDWLTRILRHSVLWGEIGINYDQPTEMYAVKVLRGGVCFSVQIDAAAVTERDVNRVRGLLNQLGLHELRNAAKGVDGSVYDFVEQQAAKRGVVIIPGEDAPKLVNAKGKNAMPDLALQVAGSPLAGTWLSTRSREDLRKAFLKAYPLPPTHRAELAERSHIVPCAWCHKPDCDTIGSYCQGYIACLAERVALGANDCPEERESVQRWCDLQCEAYELFQGQQLLKYCRECRTPLNSLTSYQSKHGEHFCAYCYNETTQGLLPRVNREQSVSASMCIARHHPSEAAASKRLEAFYGRSVASLTAAQRELANGHPSTWPSQDGEP